jgi:hypothetical protein
MQSVRPAAHDTRHTPAAQICPSAQLVPQAPQLARSVCRSRQVPEQLESPVPHDTWHTPAEHTWPAAQSVPQVPQDHKVLPELRV